MEKTIATQGATSLAAVKYPSMAGGDSGGGIMLSLSVNRAKAGLLRHSGGVVDWQLSNCSEDVHAAD